MAVREAVPVFWDTETFRVLPDWFNVTHEAVVVAAQLGAFVVMAVD